MIASGINNFFTAGTRLLSYLKTRKEWAVGQLATRENEKKKVLSHTHTQQ